MLQTFVTIPGKVLNLSAIYLVMGKMLTWQGQRHSLSKAVPALELFIPLYSMSLLLRAVLATRWTLL